MYLLYLLGQRARARARLAALRRALLRLAAGGLVRRAARRAERADRRRVRRGLRADGRRSRRCSARAAINPLQTTHRHADHLQPRAELRASRTSRSAAISAACVGGAIVGLAFIAGTAARRRLVGRSRWRRRRRRARLGVAHRRRGSAAGRQLGIGGGGGSELRASSALGPGAVRGRGRDAARARGSRGRRRAAGRGARSRRRVDRDDPPGADRAQRVGVRRRPRRSERSAS